MFPGEEDATGRPRQPSPQIRVERWIEERVSAAGMRIVFPDNLPRCDQLGVLGAEPVEGLHEPLRAVFGDQRLRGIARAAAREQGEDAGTAALLLVAIPQRAEGKRRPEGPRTSARAPARCNRGPEVREGDENASSVFPTLLARRQRRGN